MESTPMQVVEGLREKNLPIKKTDSDLGKQQSLYLYFIILLLVLITIFTIPLRKIKDNTFKLTLSINFLITNLLFIYSFSSYRSFLKSDYHF